MDVQRVVGYKQFCNKLWNIVKFALSNFPADFVPEEKGIEGLKLSLVDKWIITRLSKLINATNDQFEKFKFGEMIMGLFDFWLKELADVYIEALKPVMKGTDEEAKKAARNSLFKCLDFGLRLMHPTMPYLTEELYQRLPHRKDQVFESICIAEFPSSLQSYDDENVEEQLKTLMTVVKAFRSQFAALNILKSANPHIIIKFKTDELKASLQNETGLI